MRGMTKKLSPVSPKVSSTFPNGIPRVVHHYEMVDGLMHVIVDNTLTPVWTDQYITVNAKHMGNYSVFHEWTEFVWGVYVTQSMSHYDHSDDEEATLEFALSIQDSIFRETGETVPIYYRD